MHELIQTYFDTLYSPLENEIIQSLPARDNEIYGELYYYSAVDLLKSLNLKSTDHFLDIGSGFGKLIFQVFLTSDLVAVTGIEINSRRYQISQAIKQKIEQQLPQLFNKARFLSIIEGDYLTTELPSYLPPVSIAYLCSTVFSLQLILDMANKINTMTSIHTVVSFRKIPNLLNFTLTDRIFLHGSWDRTACYIYKKDARSDLHNKSNREDGFK